jgi:hypothetical protein
LELSKTAGVEKLNASGSYTKFRKQNIVCVPFKPAQMAVPSQDLVAAQKIE